MNLSTFWKPKTKHTFLFKSGKEISFRAENLKIETSANDLISVGVTGGEGILFYYRLDEIAAIIVN